MYTKRKLLRLSFKFLRVEWSQRKWLTAKSHDNDDNEDIASSQERKNPVGCRCFPWAPHMLIVCVKPLSRSAFVACRTEDHILIWHDTDCARKWYPLKPASYCWMDRSDYVTTEANFVVSHFYAVFINHALQSNASAKSLSLSLTQQKRTLENVPLLTKDWGTAQCKFVKICRADTEILYVFIGPCIILLVE